MGMHTRHHHTNSARGQGPVWGRLKPRRVLLSHSHSCPALPCQPASRLQHELAPRSANLWTKEIQTSLTWHISDHLHLISLGWLISLLISFHLMWLVPSRVMSSGL